MKMLLTFKHFKPIMFQELRICNNQPVEDCVGVCISCPSGSRIEHKSGANKAESLYYNSTDRF